MFKEDDLTGTLAARAAGGQNSKIFPVLLHKIIYKYFPIIYTGGLITGQPLNPTIQQLIDGRPLYPWHICSKY